MNGPPLQRLGSAILVQGQAVVDLHMLVRGGLRMHRSVDGIEPASRLRQLDQVLAEAAAVVTDELMSGVGQMSRRQQVDQACSELPEEIGTCEAAGLLHLTPRHVQRLAVDLGGRRAAGRWIFDRSTIAAAAHQRIRRRHTR